MLMFLQVVIETTHPSVISSPPSVACRAHRHRFRCLHHVHDRRPTSYKVTGRARAASFPFDSSIGVIRSRVDKRALRAPLCSNLDHFDESRTFNLHASRTKKKGVWKGGVERVSIYFIESRLVTCIQFRIAPHRIAPHRARAGAEDPCAVFMSQDSWIWIDFDCSEPPDRHRRGRGPHTRAVDGRAWSVD